MRRTRTSPCVAVIGGGFGGIAAAVQLKRRGLHDVVVFERSDGLGGTWWDNRYPGAETDAPSHLYCFSFAPFAWTRSHVRRRELQRYAEHVVDQFGLRGLFRTGLTVLSVTWDPAAHGYLLRTADDAEQRFDAVISAVGMFSAPRQPDLDGLASFRGSITHTAHWDEQIELDGRRVAIMGTGSSASQIVPAIAGRAEHVTVFQRQPAWVLPKGDHDFSRLLCAVYRIPGVWKLHRLFLYCRQDRREIGGRLFKPASWVNHAARRRSLAYIDTVFAGRPDLKKAVTPRYEFGGKRAILASGFYECLLRDDVDLVPHPLTRVTPTGVVDATGAERPIDVLVLATGFHATQYLRGLDVIGRDGRKLHEVWDGDPFAFLGMTVPGFPNFFMLYGPGTNGGLIMSNLEHQAAYAVREIERLARGAGSVEVREDVTRLFNRLLQRRIARTAFTATDSYYRSASGRVVTQWPDGASTYALATVLLRRMSTVGRRVRRA